MGTTRKKFPAAAGPVAAGLMLTLVHLIMIPVSGTSVNPARSLAPAVFAGGEYLTQVWVFIVFPLVGGALAGLVHQLAFNDDEVEAES
jgi:aquaporin Z